MKKRILWLAVVSILLLSVGCVKQKQEVTAKEYVYTFVSDSMPLPFLKAEIQGKSLTTDLKGQIRTTLSGIITGIELPFIVDKIETTGIERKVICKIEDTRYFGYVIYKRGDKYLCLTIVNKMPELKALEVLIPRNLYVSEKAPESIIQDFNRNSRLTKRENEPQILEMSVEKESYLQKMYAILGETQGTITLSEFVIDPGSAFSKENITIKGVDGKGKDISLSSKSVSRIR